MVSCRTSRLRVNGEQQQSKPLPRAPMLACLRLVTQPRGRLLPQIAHREINTCARSQRRGSQSCCDRTSSQRLGHGAPGSQATRLPFFSRAVPLAACSVALLHHSRVWCATAAPAWTSSAGGRGCGAVCLKGQAEQPSSAAAFARGALVAPHTRGLAFRVCRRRRRSRRKQTLQIFECFAPPPFASRCSVATAPPPPLSSHSSRFLSSLRTRERCKCGVPVGGCRCVPPGRVRG